MIRFENRFDEYAYRIASRLASDNIVSLDEGQWVTINQDGKIDYAVNNGVKAFMAISSMRTGRNDISVTQRVTYLLGHYEVSTDQFDTTGNYDTPMTPLAVNNDSVLTPAQAGDRVEAYSIGPPTADGFLRIVVDGSYIVPGP